MSVATWRKAPQMDPEFGCGASGLRGLRSSFQSAWTLPSGADLIPKMSSSRICFLYCISERRVARDTIRKPRREKEHPEIQSASYRRASGLLIRVKSYRTRFLDDSRRDQEGTV